jgi:hypothetical protein
MDKVAELLTGLREQRQRLAEELAGVDRAIAALETGTGSREAQPAAPYGMRSLYEAVVTYLVDAGEPKTAREIADALLAGGYQTRSEDFAATVRTMLRRTDSARVYGIRKSGRAGYWTVSG